MRALIRRQSQRAVSEVSFQISALSHPTEPHSFPGNKSRTGLETLAIKPRKIRESGLTATTNGLRHRLAAPPE
jgi:hypothetical protein